VDVEGIAGEIDRRIRALPNQTTEEIRRVRREYSRQLVSWPGERVLALTYALVERHRWVAYELLYSHPGGFSAIELDDVERLGQGLDSWGSVDAFGRYISGPAWRKGLIPDVAVQGWALSTDRWWRRAALVSTVGLNLRAAGGTGDTDKTLMICTLLIADRDDMIVKALSWALRELVFWDPDAVRRFITTNDDALAPMITREVQNKLRTGLKHASRVSGGTGPT
jgi:3-methyladenine DNA glycosylase AlkD